MKNITIKQLRAFIAVSRERNFTRAANTLHLSQSALTIAIRQLEAEINLKLFDRTTRSVHLTSHAAMFLPVAERLLHDLSRSLDNLSALADRQKGNVVAAASASFLCCILAPTVAKVHKRFPGIHVKLLNTPDNLARRVQEEEIDFGITNVRRAPHGLESFPFMEDVFGVVCPADHPLARKPGALSWEDLEGTPMVSMPDGTQTREIIASHAEIAHIVGTPICEASSIFALGAMIECGMGVAAVPAQVSRAIVSDKLVYRPLRDPQLRRMLSVIKRQGRSLSPAAVEVLRFMMDELIAEKSALIDINVEKDEFVANFT